MYLMCWMFGGRYFSLTCSGLDGSNVDEEQDDGFVCTRRVFICFMRAIGITLERLLEANPNQEMRHVVIVGKLML